MTKVPVKALTLAIEEAGSKKELWKAVVMKDLKKDPPEKIEKALN